MHILDCIRHPALALATLPGKGRGIIATKAIEAGALLEVAPVVRLTREETYSITTTPLDVYVFDWQEEPYDSAVVLGITTLLNHAPHPNARFERDFPHQRMRLYAIHPIAAQEEVTIDYNCPLWFEVQR